MEIQNTPFQGLFQTLPESRRPRQSAPGVSPLQPAPGWPESTQGSTEAPEQTAGPVQANQTRDGSSLLTPGEKQIIDLLFDNSGDDQGGKGFSLYGVQQPRRSAVIGNFLDVRG